MSTPISDHVEATQFAAQSGARQRRCRSNAAAIVREYNQADAATKAEINAIVDELLVLTS